MSKRKQKKQGFSLIESLLAIGVLIVGILSAFILVVRSLSNIPLIQSRLIAANLAQEGIELVRQKRDTNNLNGLP
jgi:Tfp pilus assembly protein PilV